jgi:PEP-CTERM motif
MKWFVSLGAALALLTMSIGHANASTVYSENFDTGNDNQVKSGYWYDPLGSAGNYTGAVVATSSGAYGNIFGNSIPVDASGSGKFLFEGTGNFQVGSIIFQSSNFSVDANTLYTVSLALTNVNTINNALIQPEIDGQLLGSPVSAAGTYTTDGWQTFSFTWNSGSNTTASLILHDFQSNSTGDDFGVDSISVASTATPEPSSLMLFSIASASLAGWRWRKRRHDPSRGPN